MNYKDGIRHNPICENTLCEGCELIGLIECEVDPKECETCKNCRTYSNYIWFHDFWLYHKIWLKYPIYEDFAKKVVEMMKKI